jgi:hypothetical protein
MDWKGGSSSTAEVVFRNWIKGLDIRVEDYRRSAADPDFRHKDDPGYYPSRFTRNDGPTYGKGAR